MIARAGNWLLGLTLAAWVTGAPYLLARLGLPLAVPLARIDGPHVYVGVALAVVLGLKIHQLHFRGALAALRPRLLAYQRWLSLGLLATYGGVIASGALLALPWPGAVERQLVNLHLLTAAWAGVVTAGHVARYFSSRVPRLNLDRRLLAGLALVLLPAALLAAFPRSASPLSRLGAGAAWYRVRPDTTPTTRLVRLPDGELAAAGGGLSLSSDGGRTWHAVPGLEATIVRAVAAAPAGDAVYAATERGVLRAPAPGGPYAATGLRAFADSVFVEAGGRVWAGGAGLWTSIDSGTTWSAAEAGLTPEGSIWTIGRFDGQLLAGASTGIYRWNGGGWDRVSTLRSVYSLDPGPHGEVWASSMGQGLQVLRGGRWQPADSGLSAHHHGGTSGIHVDGFLAARGRDLAATMESGVAESLDGGRSWQYPDPGFRPGAVWQLMAVGDRLLAATDTGLYWYPLAAAPEPGAGWWAAVVLGAAAVTLLAAALALRTRPEPAAADWPAPVRRPSPARTA